jgi:threonine/homoserine/homoserine lactone efflux protein
VDALILGATIGLAAGISPGPLLFLTITSALRSGARAGVIVACAPLLSDIVVVTVTLAVLGRMPDEALSLIGVVGGLFVGWLGVRTWLEARTASLRQGSDQPRTSTFVALREGVVVNLLSPHPWIAWGTALGPMTLAAWREKPASGVAFVVGFYALLVGAKVVLALLAGQGRRRLTDPGYRSALRVASALLVATGAVLVVEFGRSLV